MGYLKGEGGPKEPSLDPPLGQKSFLQVQIMHGMLLFFNDRMKLIFLKAV